VQILIHPLSYRANLRTDRDVLLWFLRDKVNDLIKLNAGQNRVLREDGISLAEVAAFLTKEKDEA
jgi:chlorite dismutase